MYLIANLVTVVVLVLLMLAIASASARPPKSHVINAGALTLPPAPPTNHTQPNHEADASAQGLMSTAGGR